MLKSKRLVTLPEFESRILGLAWGGGVQSSSWVVQNCTKSVQNYGTGFILKFENCGTWGTNLVGNTDRVILVGEKSWEKEERSLDWNKASQSLAVRGRVGEVIECECRVIVVVVGFIVLSVCPSVVVRSVCPSVVVDTGNARSVRPLRPSLNQRLANLFAESSQCRVVSCRVAFAHLRKTPFLFLSSSSTRRPKRACSGRRVSFERIIFPPKLRIARRVVPRSCPSISNRFFPPNRLLSPRGRNGRRGCTPNRLSRRVRVS